MNTNFNDLKNRFDSSQPFIHLTETIDCHNIPFESSCTLLQKPFEGGLPPEEMAVINDNGTQNNQRFNYSLLTPRSEIPNEVILLLHGLNERSWEKYLPWACTLVESTGKAVILFPIAFHINRAPSWWSNPRFMQTLSKRRTDGNPLVNSSSFANVALSLRMQYTPEMFPISGAQSYLDIVKLVNQIHKGKHPLIKPQAHIDIFAYSIGTILAKLLLMANPLHLFSRSKAFLFCGGAILEKVNPVSRAIMDSQANLSLKNYLSGNPNLSHLMLKPKTKARLLPQAWKLFQCFISENLNRDERQKALEKVKNRILAFSLTCDQVFSPEAVESLFGDRSINHRVAYAGSHEKPFPFDNQPAFEEVNATYRRVFETATRFFSNQG